MRVNADRSFVSAFKRARAVREARGDRLTILSNDPCSTPTLRRHNAAAFNSSVWVRESNLGLQVNDYGYTLIRAAFRMPLPAALGRGQLFAGPFGQASDKMRPGVENDSAREP